MITAADVVGMTDLTAEEVGTIAAHDHLPQFSAARLANYLLHSYKGPKRVLEMICDDIRSALHSGDLTEATDLYAILHRFIADHPEAARNPA